MALNGLDLDFGQMEVFAFRAGFRFRRQLRENGMAMAMGMCGYCMIRILQNTTAYCVNMGRWLVCGIQNEQHDMKPNHEMDLNYNECVTLCDMEIGEQVGVHKETKPPSHASYDL